MKLGTSIARLAQVAFAHPRIGIRCALLAMLLTSPSLFAGTQLDDDFHRAVLTGFPGSLAPASTSMGMFAFIDSDPKRTALFLETGVLPWWTAPEIRAAFWRPVSELTHRLDFQLWPEHPALMHLQNLLWLAAAVLTATFLYRRLLGPAWIGGFAAFLWAVDSAHGMPVGWIANRNAVVAVCLGFATLALHDQWRRQKWKAGAVLAPMVFCVALLSGESALAVTAYLFAYALFIDGAALTKRAATLIPYGVITVAWRAAYQHLGYGSFGSGLYIDPASDPKRFAFAAIQRAPLLLEGLLGPVPSDADLVFAPWGHWLFVAGASVALVGVFVIALRLIGKQPSARFFAVGSVLSVLPACATFPSDRLLFFAGFGGFGLVAQFVGAVAEASAPARSARWACRVLIALHAVLAPMLLPVRVLTVSLLTHKIAPCVEQAPDDPAVARDTLVFVNAGEFCAAYLPLRRGFAGGPIPTRIRTLVNAITPCSLRREDERTVVLERPDGFFSRRPEQLLRDPDLPWHVGDRVELSDMTVEIRSLTAKRLPRTIAFRFSVPVDDPSLRWFDMKGGAMTPFAIPAIGAPAVDVPPSVTF